MANTRRVVVTGIGLVSSLGIGTDANWNALRAGCSGVATITKFDASQFATRIAGEVRGFDPLRFIEKKDVKKMDVFIQYAIAASQFAMDDARLTITPELAPNAGVFIASGIGGFTTIEREHKAYLDGGPRKISPFFIPSAIINLAAGQGSIPFGPLAPKRIDTSPAARLMMADGMKSGEILRGPPSRYALCSRSIVVNPPIPDAMSTPTRVASSGVIVKHASSMANCAAATAYWMKTSIFLTSFFSMKARGLNPRTSPAIRVANCDASNLVIVA